jgi:hypothetical protein
MQKYHPDHIKSVSPEISKAVSEFNKVADKRMELNDEEIRKILGSIKTLR